MIESKPKKRGRPRKHPSNAEKQRAYRTRKQELERKALIRKILGRRAGVEGDSLMTLSIRQLKRWKRAVS
jgi:hypothetical protein